MGAPLKETTISIMGRHWKVTLLSDEAFSAEHGRADAITITSPRALNFKQSDRTIETVRHEMFHAYCTGLFLGSTTRVRNDDFEEIIAEMLGEYLDELASQSKEVHQWLTRAT